ncbi:MAG: AMP-binding protein, partial [Acidimicrobiales bacterium]
MSPLVSLLWTRSMTAGHRPYLRHARSERVLTYAGARRSADRWAGLLEDLGVAPGAAVGVVVSDPLDFSAVFLGVMASGRVVAPLDPNAPDAELAAACARLDVAAVIGDRRPAVGARTDWVVLPPGTFELDEGAGSGAAQPTVGHRGGGGLLLGTSGTTGTPKRIRLGEAQLLHTAGCVVTHHRLSVADRGFCPLPLFHVNAEVVGLLATLAAGATLVVDERFHRTGFWDLMARHRVTWVNAVPAILARLTPLRSGESVPSGIRFARSASAPLPVAVLERFEDATGVPVVETYGMTEAGSQITANPLSGPRKPGSVGLPVGIELRVVTEPASTPPVAGPVEIRGPGVVTGTEQWLVTGDLGYLDDDGYLYLAGRVDDVINRGGEKIFPREVEEVLLADPGVVAAVVVGWEHEALGQV